ncbi:MAG: ATP-binding protein [Desulfobacterales bacterium]|nr:ATP-binding protein [Desulfobacterales bacterium]
MKTYTKILLATLPLVFFFLITILGINYYFSRKALLDLGETWLDTRLSMALEITKDQEKILHDYGLEKIPASIAKAKLDAISQMRNIRVGEKGYIFAVNSEGTIVFHPNKYLKDTDLSQEQWFEKLAGQKGRLVIDLAGEPILARFELFAPWNWYILAVDPMEEVYGVSNRMTPYLFALIASAAVIISLALMFLTKRLTLPLKKLVQGAEQIAKGNLDTRIDIKANDEFGHLAKEFNQMAFKLEDTLEALKYNEEHFRALIENASDLIWILDKNGTFTYVSPSTKRILGYSQDDLLGKNAFDFVHPKDKDELLERFKLRAKSLIKSQPTPHRFRHKEEYWCTLESISKNLLDHPAISGMVINSRNISKRKQAEEALKMSHQELENRVEERTRELQALNKTLNNEIQIRKQKEKELERANQAKNDFLANVSHEIRTPLNSVLGFSELLSTMITEKQQAGYLSAINTAGNNLLELINDILDLSKMEAGKLKINRGPVSIDILFKEMFHLFRAKLDKKNLDFAIELPVGPEGSLFLDEMRLRQVITNLIDNAVKFTTDGMITLKAQFTPNSGSPENCIDLEIQVQDTGLGIPQEKLDVIFESFQQESAGTSKKFGGTGLGLAICKQLTELMGGSISVSSSAGKGSVFTILLPEVERHIVKHAAHTAKKADLNTICFSKERILVVDDRYAIRFMLREIFEKINLDVIEAENGEQALEMARTEMPRLIFMDAKMPVLNGMDATAQLKSDPATKHIAVCLMTADVEQSFRKDLADKGFACSLAKPIVIDELMEVLNQFIKQAPQADDTLAPALDQLKQIDTATLSSVALEKLEKEIFPTVPALQEAMKASDIQRFATKVTEFGKECESEVFIAFGEELFHQAETFDIEGINLSLKYFSSIVEQIVN